MKQLKLCSAVIAALLACASAPAKEYLVVVPVPARTANPAISVSLAASPVPSALMNQPYAGFDFSKLLNVSGDPEFTGYGVTWTVTAGALPPGLSLSATGTLQGTPTASGNYSFTIQAAYKTKSGATAYQLVSTGVTVALAAADAPAATEQMPYAYDFSSRLSVDDPAFTSSSVVWSVASGTLPPGLSLSPSTGVVAGIPTAAGTFNVTLRASYKGSNGTQGYKLVVSNLVVALAPATLPAATIATPYAFDFTPLLSANDATPVGGVSWAAVGSLPEGLSLNSSTGVLYGTPVTAGTYPISLKATYKTKTGASVYQLVVGGMTIGLAGGSFSNLSLGKAFSYDFSQKLSVTGDATFVPGAGATWHVAGGSLPDGLSLDPSTGVVSGTPSKVGAFPFTLGVTYKTLSGDQAYQLVVTSIEVALDSWTLPATKVGVSVSYDFKTKLHVTNDATYTGTGVTWSVVGGNLPPGMSLNATTGVLSGAPSEGGTYAFTLQAAYKDAQGTQTYSKVVSTIDVSLASATLPRVFVNTPVAYDFTNKVAVTGDAAYAAGQGLTWDVSSGALPPGVTINHTSGVMSGAPTSAGTYPFSLKVTYKTESAETAYTQIVRSPVVSLSGGTLTSGVETYPYAYDFTPRLTVTGDPDYVTGQDVSWSTTSGTLPNGVTLDAATGVLYGTPAAAGTFPISVQADYLGLRTSRAYDVVINPVTVALAEESLAIQPTDVPFSFNLKNKLSVTDPNYTGSGVTYSIAAGTLPPGVSFNAATATLSGTPTTAGNYTVTAQATYRGKVGTRSYTIPVEKYVVSISGVKLAVAAYDAQYSETLLPNTSVTGDSAYLPGSTTNLQWAVTAGSLPSGMSLDAATGLISGKSTVAGTHTFDVTVTYRSLWTATATFQLEVKPMLSIKLQPGGYRTWSDGSLATSCLAYRSGNYTGDVGDGQYQLYVAGVTATVTCDMTNGGWTFVANRLKTGIGGPNTTLVSSATTTAAYLPDAVWQSLKATASAFRAVPPTLSLANGPAMAMSSANAANCTPLTSSLSAAVLIHDETVGCEAGGGDYTMIGTLASVRPAYITNRSGRKFSPFAATYYEGANLTIWVK